MGSGIAALFAKTGCTVQLVDRNEDLLRKSEENIRKILSVLTKADRLSSDDITGILERINHTTDLDSACEGADLLVEAITEDLAVKREMFARFDRLCLEGAVLVSNTSGLSITKIAQATRRSHLVAGMHFWNPPHIIPLVEVIRGDETNDDTAQFLTEVARRLGKRPIIVRRDVPGFVGNRLQFAVMREAFHLLSEGIASAEDIDTAMTAGPGLRYGFLGPLKTADLGGLDIFLAISEYLFSELNSEKNPSAILSELVGKGKLGAKTGEGIYGYSGGNLEETLAERDRVLLGFIDVIARENRGGER